MTGYDFKTIIGCTLRINDMNVASRPYCIKPCSYVHGVFVLSLFQGHHSHETWWKNTFIMRRSKSKIHARGNFMFLEVRFNIMIYFQGKKHYITTWHMTSTIERITILLIGQYLLFPLLFLPIHHILLPPVMSFPSTGIKTYLILARRPLPSVL